MEDLKKVINQLKNGNANFDDYEDNENRIISILQKIGKEIVTHYEIKLDDLTIDPVWVEAYYYNKYEFPDCNLHMDIKQKNNDESIYFHTRGYGGFDVCLSDNENYLSFLIKGYLIEGKYYSQTGIYEYITSTYGKEKQKDIIRQWEDLQRVLEYNPEKSKIGTKVATLQRMNLEKPTYIDKPLGIFRIDSAFEKYNFSLPVSHAKTWRKAVYQIVQSNSRIESPKNNYEKLANEEVKIDGNNIFIDLQKNN